MLIGRLAQLSLSLAQLIPSLFLVFMSYVIYDMHDKYAMHVTLVWKWAGPSMVVMLCIGGCD